VNRWIRWAARLYPAEWRTRYGAEFDALLDDAPLRWSDLRDVLRGAAMMQMTTWMTWRKMALLSGLVGALIAAGIAFSIQDQYLCSASISIEKQGGTSSQAQQTLQQVLLHVLSRDSMTNLVKDPALGLYKAERQRLSAEQVANDILRKHLRVFPYGGADTGVRFRIVFSDPDRNKAKLVVDRLTAQFLREMFSAPDGSVMRVLEGAIQPQMPVYPNRLAIIVIGLVSGTMLGLLSLAGWRRTRTYAVMTMSLPRETKSFVDRQVAGGQYRSAADYVNELIRADEEKHK
jgi:capsular polysaccharide biosynthesis protein